MHKQTNKRFNNKSNNSNPAFKSKLTGDFPKLEIGLKAFLKVYQRSLNECKKTHKNIHNSISVYHAHIDEEYKESPITTAFKEHYEANKNLSGVLESKIKRITQVLDKIKALKSDGFKNTIELWTKNGYSHISANKADCGVEFYQPSILKDIITGNDSRMEETLNNLITNNSISENYGLKNRN